MTYDKRTACFESLEDRRLLAFNPSGYEQESLYYINRMRTDPHGEFARLVDNIDPISSPIPSVNWNLQGWNVNGHELQRQWSSLTPVPPVAWNESLLNAARAHNAVMIEHNEQSHQLPGEPDVGQRLRNAGYNYRRYAENVGAYCVSALECHAGYVIDWGPGAHGIQEPPGHRINIMNADLREVGTGVTIVEPNDPFNDVGPFVNTQDFGTQRSEQTHVIGTVFDDRNLSESYEAGEGLGNIQIELSGPNGTFRTASMSAGGFQIQVPPGTYSATASGEGLDGPLTTGPFSVGNQNVLVNFRQFTEIPADSFEVNDTFAQATRLGNGDQRLSSLTIHSASDVDIFKWTAPDNVTVDFEIYFSHANGDLDLYLYNQSQDIVASSTTETDNETISHLLQAGQDYFLEIFGYQGAISRDYELSVDSPVGSPPQANNDKTATDLNTAVVINVTNNDLDADGDLDLNTVQIVTLPSNGEVTLGPGAGEITYLPDPEYWGGDSFKYRVLDSTGLASNVATAKIGVVDYSGKPWHNHSQAFDANNDTFITPIDALLVINYLNHGYPSLLPSKPSGENSPLPFVDLNGDGFATPIDALLVINHLNNPDGEGEAFAVPFGSGNWYSNERFHEFDDLQPQTVLSKAITKSKTPTIPTKPGKNLITTEFQLGTVTPELWDRALNASLDEPYSNPLDQEFDGARGLRYRLS